MNQRLGLGARGLAALAITLSTGLGAAAQEVPFYPLEEVKPGQKGVGRTVFSGTQVVDFDVEVIGLLENFGPRQSMVLARLSGGPLAETGVIAGMSGSPVYIDGKLLGAVAYGFPFSKQTIAGITPIGEMVDAAKAAPAAPRAASARFPASAFGPEAFALPLSRAALVAPFVEPGRLAAVARVPRANASGGTGPALAPLHLPLAFSGFDRGAFEAARGLFESLGFAPVFTASPRGVPPGPLPDLAPGGAVGVSLVEGDFDLSATGTITHIDKGRVYAFGHPFYNLGPTRFPMKKAYVFDVFPSLYQSWKISSPASEAVGTMDQDRATAIAGPLGPAPRMIPVTVTLKTSRGDERRFELRVVEDELFTPVLAYLSVYSVLQANERAYGTQTVRLEARLALEGRPEVRVEDLLTESNPSLLASGLAAAPLAYLMANSLEPVRVSGLTITVESYEDERSARLERVWVEAPGPLRPGTTVSIKSALRGFRGDVSVESVPFRIPDSAPAGNYTLLVADGDALTLFEQRELRQRYEPRTLDQLIRAINGLRRSDRLYYRLVRLEDGAVVGGEWLPALPPSMLSVLGATQGAEPLVRTRTASAWDFELPLPFAVRGSRSLPFVVER